MVKEEEEEEKPAYPKEEKKGNTDQKKILKDIIKAHAEIEKEVKLDDVLLKLDQKKRESSG
jgi:hypothetical protein